jgi:hypothetical protein
MKLPALVQFRQKVRRASPSNLLDIISMNVLDWNCSMNSHISKKTQGCQSPFFWINFYRLSRTKSGSRAGHWYYGSVPPFFQNDLYFSAAFLFGSPVGGALRFTLQRLFFRG